MGRLSATFIRSAKKPGRYTDGPGSHGLSLLVREKKSGGFSKTFSQRLRVHDKVRHAGLGAWPLTTLKEAREKAFENARAAKEGRDPFIAPPRCMTFEEVAEQVIETMRPSWRHPRTEEKWRSSLCRYAFPMIGNMEIDDITASDVIDMLLADGFWHSTPTIAKKVRQRTSAIMKVAVARGWRVDDPAGPVIDAALPKQTKRGHFRALHHTQIPDLIERIRAADDVWIGTRLAIEFVALTCARGAEVRGAVLSELDVDERMWVVPGSRTKTGVPFRVPLSEQALAVIEQALTVRRNPTGPWLLFPSRRGKAHTDGVLSLPLRERGLATVHGIRASARSWMAETGVARDLAEMCLGHAVQGVEAAYQRSDIIERRRQVLEDWNDYIAPR